MNSNTVSYDRYNLYLPSLFFGYIGLPQWISLGYGPDSGNLLVEPRRGGDPSPASVRLDPEISILRHQTSGFLCRNLDLFGVFLSVDSDTGLEDLIKAYQDSQISTPTLGEVKEYQNRLRQIGLDLNDNTTDYMGLQEAYLPTDAEKLWRYAMSRNPMLLMASSDTKSAVPWDGLEAMMLFIDENRRRLFVETSLHPVDTLFLNMGMGRQTSGIIFENSD